MEINMIIFHQSTLLDSHLHLGYISILYLKLPMQGVPESDILGFRSCFTCCVSFSKSTNLFALISPILNMRLTVETT